MSVTKGIVVARRPFDGSPLLVNERRFFCPDAKVLRELFPPYRFYKLDC
jgi:hypothetical protein